MTSPTATTFPDARAVIDAVVDARRIAVLREHGPDAVLTTAVSDALTPDGVHVRLTTRRIQRQAIADLSSLGYVVQADDPRTALLVTGWDDKELAARAAILEQAANELRHEYPSVAAFALGAYRYSVDSLRRTPDDAERIVAESLWLKANHRPQWIAQACRRAHRRQPVAPADIDAAPEATRALLARIAAADAVLDKLPLVYTGTVRGVISLFTARRQVQRDLTDNEAAAAVLRDVAAVKDSCLAIADADLDPRDYPKAPGDTRVTPLQMALFDSDTPDEVPLAERLTVNTITNSRACERAQA